LFLSLAFYAQENYKKTLSLMGSRFEITVVADSQETGDRYLQMAIGEITRIEKIISSWTPQSETSEINRNAGIRPVTVSKELFQLIVRSCSVSKLTEGAFDISYASMDALWKFDGTMKKKPSATQIKASVKNVGFQNIELNKEINSVFLKNKGMKIGFGAIGKGYAADKARSLLQSKGVKGGLINASGDLNAWGKQANGNDWMVAITNPMNKKKAFSWMPVNNSAIVTSGNYERFVIFEGLRYAHIIDPRTGMPSTGIQSVTVFTKNAELADALSTALFVMGVTSGLDFANQLKGVECIFVDDDNQLHRSENIQFNTTY
jgi:thiamine biosynthesis lipoprotein